MVRTERFGGAAVAAGCVVRVFDRRLPPHAGGEAAQEAENNAVLTFPLQKDAWPSSSAHGS